MSAELVIDYSFDVPPPAAIKAAGYIGVMRYLSRDSSKSIQLPEVRALQAEQLGIGLVFEDSAQRALGGYPAGLEDGNFANAAADALGFPKDLPICYAVDFDVQPAQMSIVLAYLQAANTTGRVAHGYGSAALVDYLAAHNVFGSWQTCAWSQGLVDNKAVLYQRLRPTTTLQGSYDEDVVLDPAHSGLWFPSTQRYKMLVYAEGLDAATAFGVAAPRRVGVVTTSQQEAKDAISRGEKVIVLGGPAAKTLGFTATPNQTANQGSATIAVGATAEDTRDMANQLIK